MLSHVFTYIWEYRVKPEHQDAFEHAYGPHGEWVSLFRKGSGYISTELHQDINQSDRFITIDCWTSKEAFHKFKKQFHDEFITLDKRFEALIASENHIGDFEGHIEKYKKE